MTDPINTSAAYAFYRAGLDLEPKAFCKRVKSTVDEFTVGCEEESLDDFTILQVKVEI